MEGGQHAAATVNGAGENRDNDGGWWAAKVVGGGKDVIKSVPPDNLCLTTFVKKMVEGVRS